MNAELIGLVKRSDLAKRFGVAATTIDRWCKNIPEFPKPVKIIWGVWFKVDEVNAFVESCYDLKGKAITYCKEQQQLRAKDDVNHDGKHTRSDVCRCR